MIKRYLTVEQERLINKAVDDFEPHETFFFWHHKSEDLNFGTNDDMTEQMKIWRKEAKKGLLVVREANNRTFEIKGKKYHILVVQDIDDDKNPLDPLALGVKYHVFGLVYFFKHKHNRDVIFEYLNKGVKS